MSLFREYLQPQSIQEALHLLASPGGQAAVIAGGTDLLLELRQGRHAPVDRLIDVSGIPELQVIEIREGMVYLGAAVTHKRIISDRIMLEHARCVVEGCGLIGGPQVRNVATIGGNVSHALPAGDGTISLLALDTEVQLAGPEGNSWQELNGIFAGPGKVNFDRERQIVAGFRFKVRGEREASAFQRVMRPQGVAIAILNMAAWVRLSAQDTLEQVRLSCGPAGPKPFRARETERFLTGKTWTLDLVPEAAEVLTGEVSLRTSAYRATKEYRQQLLPVLLRDVLEKAVLRANT